MTPNAEELELKERLNLIESMIAEGRQTTENWGWMFVLWGVAYYVAILWTSLGHFAWAWPITMCGALVFVSAMMWRKRMKPGRKPETTMGRAIASIWIGIGISMALLFPSLGFSGRIDEYIMVSVAAAMLGAVNASSSLILRWKMQFACALVWWATSIFACFGKSKQVAAAFLVAIFLCQIVFGVYGMISVGRRNRQGARHV
jgi:hypothetical protein